MKVEFVISKSSNVIASPGCPQASEVKGNIMYQMSETKRHQVEAQINTFSFL